MNQQKTMTPQHLETLRGLQKKLAGLKAEAKLYGSPFPDSKRQVAEDAYASYEALTALLAEYEKRESVRRRGLLNTPQLQSE